ncbi:unnamed protein product, partial [Sphacelaria rigidula]
QCLCRLAIDNAVMRERTACLEDRAVARNTSRSTLSKTNRASPCRNHAPDPNPNTNPSPDLHHRDVQIPMRSSMHAILSRIGTHPFRDGAQGDGVGGIGRLFSRRNHCKQQIVRIEVYL